MWYKLQSMSISINGQLYEASSAGGKTWMVKRYANDDPGTKEYVESLIESEESDPVAVVKEAIARNSWA